MRRLPGKVAAATSYFRNPAFRTEIEASVLQKAQSAFWSYVIQLALKV
jgi:hypothetical protein